MAVDYDSILGVMGTPSAQDKGTPSGVMTPNRKASQDAQSLADNGTSDALAILNKERSKPGLSSTDKAEIDKLIAGASAQQRKQPQQANQTAPQQAPQGTGGVDYDAVSGMLTTPIDTQYPNTAGGGRGVQGGPTAAQFSQRQPVTAKPVAVAGPGQITSPEADLTMHIGSGLVAPVWGGLKGLYTLAKSGGDLNAAVDAIHQGTADATYQPRTQDGQTLSQAFDSNYNPANWIPRASQYVGDKVGDAVGETSPVLGALAKGAGAVAPFAIGSKTVRDAVGSLSDLAKPDAAPLPVAARVDPVMEGAPTPKSVDAPSPASISNLGTTAAQKSVGAAGTSLETAFSQATPEMQKAFNEAKAAGVNIDPEAAARHLEADSLPVPIRLMPGQAHQNVHLLSDEMNLRAKVPEYANRFNLQGEQLKSNLDAIKDKAAPDVYATGPTENGQAIMDSYKSKDAALKTDIGEKYQALKDANGGDFPIDAQAFVSNADALLKKDLKSEFVPTSIASQLEKFRNGEPMNFEQFEAMRTNLANEMRKAERSGDGNSAYASGLVRQALEDVPLSPEAAALKPIADAARSAAKARFDLINSDPAYKAVVNDTVAPDNFVNKYVVNGKLGDVRSMKANLSDDPLAQQHMAAGTIDWMRQKAGIVNGQGNFTQAGYNKALMALHEKLSDQVGPEAARTMGTLGNVARYVQAQPRGSYVNNSGTFVAGAKSYAAGALEGAVNVAAKGIPVGSWVRGAFTKRAQAKATQETLKTGAGLGKLSDLNN